jgi:hypothetical protein
MLRRAVLVSLVVMGVSIVPARAHFLFVRIMPPAEGGRPAEVYFSELAEAGDPRFIDKIAQTQLWVQTVPGKFESLQVHKATDRLRAFLPGTGSLMVVGNCPYGVLARSKQPAFLLRHFPKAIAGIPEELGKLTPHGKLPLEIAITIEGDRLHFVALRDGKPMPQAEFITVDAELNNEKIAAGTDGKGTWKPPRPGNYAVYTRDTRKESGEFNGKKYDEIRDFATIAFRWPLVPSADSAAISLFEEAIAARASWHDFPGFTAQVAGNLDGRRFAGTVSIDARGSVAFSDNDSSREESVSPWVVEQLESIVLHRLARPAGKSRPALWFGEDRADHPLGRLLVFDGGKFASSYRVKDKQIMVVNRSTGRENMTIIIQENVATPEGKFLPRCYSVQYWDAASGALKRTETVHDRWARVGSWDLPAAHTVTTASSAGVSICTMTLSRHELQKK